MPKKISIIIPWRPSKQNDRNIIAEWCFKRYRYLFPDAEIICCDAGGDIFSRGRSINKGVSECTGDYIIITDADYLFSPAMAKEIINKQPWTVGVKTKNYFYLNSAITSRIVSSDPNIDIKEIKNLDINISPCPYFVYGGLMAMPKENFMQVKYDPNFVGYGYEDNAFYHAMRAFFGKEFRTNQKMYHLFHHRAIGEYMYRSYENKKYFDTNYIPILHQNKLIKQYVEKYNQIAKDDVC